MNPFKWLDRIINCDLYRREGPKMPVHSQDWKTRGLPLLQNRLRALANDDNLVPLLLQLLDEFGADDLNAGLGANVDDGEAHRFRGRLGMNVELRGALVELWQKSRERKEE